MKTQYNSSLYTNKVNVYSNRQGFRFRSILVEISGTYQSSERLVPDQLKPDGMLLPVSNKASLAGINSERSDF